MESPGCDADCVFAGTDGAATGAEAVRCGVEGLDAHPVSPTRTSSRTVKDGKRRNCKIEPFFTRVSEWSVP